jgi:hypothetical protein
VTFVPCDQAGLPDVASSKPSSIQPVMPPGVFMRFGSGGDSNLAYWSGFPDLLRQVGDAHFVVSSTPCNRAAELQSPRWSPLRKAPMVWEVSASVLRDIPLPAKFR